MRKTIFSIITIIGIIISMTACDGNSKKRTLTAHEWSLQSVVNADSTSAISVPAGVTIHFSDSTMVFGRGGCNGFFGPYKVEGKNKINIGPLGSTMMWCMNMPFEDAYFKMLDAATRFEASETELVLTDDDGKFKLTYMPSAEQKTTME